MKHAFHRGKVAKDGYFADNSIGKRYLKLSTVSFFLLGALFMFSLKLGLIILFTVSLFFELMFLKRISLRHLGSLHLYIIPFLLAYSLGYFQAKRFKN